MKRTPTNYIDKKEFYDLMVAHKKRVDRAEAEGREPPPACNKIGANILQIARGIGSRYNFSKYPYREEMISDGIIDACAAINKFDPESSKNPFGYFSTCIWYAFLHRIDQEKEEMYVKYKMTEMGSLTGALVEGTDTESFNGVIEDNEFRDDFVSAFEKRQQDKKRKRDDRKSAKEAEETEINTSLFVYEDA